MFNQTTNILNIIGTITALILISVPLLVVNSYSRINAAELTGRSVEVESSTANEVTNHLFRYSANTAIVIGSMEMEYCTNSPFIGDSCTVPAGLDLTGSSVGAQTGLTGFTVHGSTTANRLVISRAPALVTPTVNATVRIDNITNPSVVNQTIYVRISTYATNDGTGARGDTGTVVFSINESVSVTGFVPPFLIFCVGDTVADDCSASTGNNLSFGEFSTTATRLETSQFAVATNDPFGYILTIQGATLTSGNFVIPGSTTPASSTPGVSQFGINLRSNTVPSVGADITGAGTGTPTADYNTSNSFSFDNEAIALSAIPTEFNTFTVSYIANISSDQNPGVYSTTITYIATAQF